MWKDRALTPRGQFFMEEKVSPVAKHVIDKCGGAVRIAEWLGVTQATVHKWKYPKSRGGKGGLVPAEHQQTLMRIAPEHGVDLQPEDFFPSAGLEAAE
jgi:hypothetical protein